MFIKSIYAIMLLVIAASNLAHSQQIDFIVSASAGGPNDTVTRKIVEKLEMSTPLRFIIFNKSGAAHTIAYQHMINTTKPTLILSTSEILTHSAYSHLDEVFNLGYFTNIMFVSEASGIKNIKHMIELSKTREILFGNSGPNSSNFIAMEKVCKSMLRCLPVPFRSGVEGIVAVMGGHVDTYAIASMGSNRYIENTKIVPIYEISGHDNWFKLFAKNISKKELESIINVLSQSNSKFYEELGLKHK